MNGKTISVLLVEDNITLREELSVFSGRVF